jgi:chemotaxis protein methyltransferase CheR
MWDVILHHGATPMADSVPHERRRALRRRLVELSSEMAHVERQLLGGGAGEPLPALHLLVEAAGRRALIAASQLQEILSDVEINPLPDAPPHVRGTFLYRGRHLPAVDLASWLGAPRQALQRVPAIAVAASSTFGLAVDSVRVHSGALVVTPGAPPPGSVGEVHGPAGRLPVIDALELARESEDRPGAAEEGLFAAQVRGLAAEIRRACGASLSPRLRAWLRAHLAAGATELRLDARRLVPHVLTGDPDAVTAFLERVVSGETYFLRHPEQLTALRQLLFDPADRNRPLSVWSAGCASGEEPYTLAMMLLEAGRASSADRILATDVSDAALAHARAGVYGRWSLRRGLPELARYLVGGPGRVQVVPEARRLVEFRRHDLVAEAPPGGPFDVVVCRNVLHLLEPAQQAPAIRTLLAALRPGGYLLLAPSEVSLTSTMLVERVSASGATLLRRPWPRPSRRPLRPAELPAAPAPAVAVAVAGRGTARPAIAIPRPRAGGEAPPAPRGPRTTAGPAAPRPAHRSLDPRGRSRP